MAVTHVANAGSTPSTGTTNIQPAGGEVWAISVMDENDATNPANGIVLWDGVNGGPISYFSASATEKASWNPVPAIKVGGGGTTPGSPGKCTVFLTNTTYMQFQAANNGGGFWAYSGLKVQDVMSAIVATAVISGFGGTANFQPASGRVFAMSYAGNGGSTLNASFTDGSTSIFMQNVSYGRAVGYYTNTKYLQMSNGNAGAQVAAVMGADLPVAKLTVQANIAALAGSATVNIQPASGKLWRFAFLITGGGVATILRIWNGSAAIGSGAFGGSGGQATSFATDYFAGLYSNTVYPQITNAAGTPGTYGYSAAEITV